MRSINNFKAYPKMFYVFFDEGGKREREREREKG